MTLYRRRIDHRMLLFSIVGIAIIYLLTKYLSREALAALFYYLMPPLIIILSLILFAKRSTRPQTSPIETNF